MRIFACHALAWVGLDFFKFQTVVFCNNASTACAAFSSAFCRLQQQKLTIAGDNDTATATIATAQSPRKNEMRPLLKTKDSTVGDYNDCSGESHAIDVDITSSSTKDDGTTIKRRHSWTHESP